MAINSVDDCTEAKVKEVLYDFTFTGALSFITDNDLIEIYEGLNDPNYCNRLKKRVKNELTERHIYTEK